MMPRAISVLCVVLLLGACAAVGPNYERPQIGLPFCLA